MQLSASLSFSDQAAPAKYSLSLSSFSLSISPLDADKRIYFYLISIMCTFTDKSCFCYFPWNWPPASNCKKMHKFVCVQYSEKRQRANFFCPEFLLPWTNWNFLFCVKFVFRIDFVMHVLWYRIVQYGDAWRENDALSANSRFQFLAAKMNRIITEQWKNAFSHEKHILCSSRSAS